MSNRRCYKCLNNLSESDRQQHGLHELCFMEWFTLSSNEDFADVVVRNAGSPAGRTGRPQFSGINSSFFHGTYKKYSAVLGGQSYILKVKDSRYPELPASEYLSNQIARHLKLHVPHFFYIKHENATDTFVTRNFMQDITAGNLVHIYNYLEEKEDFNCENLIRIISEKTGRLSEIERFTELCLFDALIGNHDRHGRNIALIQTKKGFDLSPFYDNPTYLGIEEDLLGAQLEPRGKIWTANSKEPTMKDYVVEFIRLGHREVIEGFRARTKLDDIFLIIEDSFISEKRKRSLRLLIERRFKELVNGLSN